MSELIIISSPEKIKNETKIVNSLFSAGLKLFHLRKPNFSVAACEEYILNLEPEFMKNISLHQHHELAADYGIHRFHFTDENRKKTDSRIFEKLKQNNSTLSTSCHSWNEVAALPEFWDYVFFGPLFDSISKSGYKSVLDKHFTLTEKKSPTKIIAIGGINKSNITTVFEKSFDGAALLGAIWNVPQNALQEFKTIKKSCTTFAHTH